MEWKSVQQLHCDELKHPAISNLYPFQNIFFTQNPSPLSLTKLTLNRLPPRLNPQGASLGPGFDVVHPVATSHAPGWPALSMSEFEIKGLVQQKNVKSTFMDGGMVSINVFIDKATWWGGPRCPLHHPISNYSCTCSTCFCVDSHRNMLHFGSWFHPSV